jgi:hypothetical protein
MRQLAGEDGDDHHCGHQRLKRLLVQLLGFGAVGAVAESADLG